MKKLFLVFLFLFIFSGFVFSTHLDPNRCTDSDGGKKYYIKGTTEIRDGSGTVLQSETDTCNGDVLTSFFCDTNSTMSSQTYTCPQGCVDGACTTASAPVSCNDPDAASGNDIFVRTTTSSGSESIPDFCDTRTGDLVETYCSSGGKVEIAGVRCVYHNGGTCFDGACMSACSDSDNDQDPNVAGAITINGGSDERYRRVLLDECSPDGQSVTERYCAAHAGWVELARSTTFNCPDGCSNGKCINIQTLVRNPTRCFGGWANCRGANADDDRMSTASRNQTGAWYRYNFSGIPRAPFASVTKVEVGADLDSGSIELSVSANGGRIFGPVHTINGPQDLIWINLTTDLPVSRSGIPVRNIMVRLKCLSEFCSLDAAPVRVSYTTLGGRQNLLGAGTEFLQEGNLVIGIAGVILLSGLAYWFFLRKK